jgi:DNA invertase Pin-like site-specific DNA recombinase
MRAAIYARYSTDKQKIESSEDQLVLLRKRCATEGWTVAGEFADPGISGGTANRPGYQRMLAAARRKAFDVVVAEDTSRLWRSMAEQAPRLAEWKDLGIALVTLSGIDSRQQGFALVAPMMGAFAELARTEASYRTRRGLQANAQRGHSTGGRAYGYRSMERDGKKVLVVDHTQAAVVRQIFEWYAEGTSPKTIAARLNEQRVPSPGAGWNRTGEKRRDGKWLASAIHGQPEKGTGILNNVKYVGRLNWGRTSWTRSAQDSKVRRVAHLARADVVGVDESLRIVGDEVWNRVQARRLAVRARTKALNHAGGKGPRYAFSGLLTCADCGSRYVIISKSSYGCATNINGGPAACNNKKRVKRAVIEERLTAAMQDDLLTKETMDSVLRHARRLMAEKRANAGATEMASAKRRKDLEGKVAALVEAIASGGLRSSPAIAGALAAAESELAVLTVPERPKAQVVELMPQAQAAYRKMVAALPGQLAKEPDKARAILSRLFQRIQLQRTPDGGLVARLETSPAALIALVSGSVSAMDGLSGSGGVLPIQAIPLDRTHIAVVSAT